MLPVLVVGAIAPALLLMWFFHGRDVYPEPRGVVWTTFGLGVAIVIPAAMIEQTLDLGIKHIPNWFVHGGVEGYMSAGLTEEALKYCVVVFYCMRHKEFDEPMDGIVYGAIASLGFAAFENFFYVLEGGGGVAIMRALLSVPGHACMGAIMGYFIGQAKFRPGERSSLMLKAFLIPALLHGTYDAPLMAVQQFVALKPSQDQMVKVAPLALVTPAIFIFELVWTLILTSRLRREQLQWAARRWQAYYARQPDPPPPWGYLPVAPAPSPNPYAYANAHAYANANATYAYANANANAYANANANTRPAVPPAGAMQPLGQGAQGVPAPPSSAIGWVQLAFGGMMVCFGGLMTLGAFLLVVNPPPEDPHQPLGMVIGVGVVMGVIPLALGVLLFALGLRRLTRATPTAPPGFVRGY
jgi:RsiW-degrading membrane proteinase PrsW (M82 family)